MTKRYNNGSIFAEPVDYMALGILDYPKVIRSPMDLSTLRRNLLTHKYIFIGDFLRDAELIFENCRVYNGNSNDGFYRKAADDCERFFVMQICKMREYNLTFAGYKKLVGKDEVAQSAVKSENDQDAGEQQFNIQNVQNLVRKLQELPDYYMMGFLKDFCRTIQQDVDFEVPEFKINFSLKNQDQLKQLDSKVTQKLAEIKARKGKKKTAAGVRAADSAH